MAPHKGPGIDRFLMRAKDVIWLVGLAYTLFQGIQMISARFKALESTIITQNVTITKILVEERDIKELLNQIQYPNRYPRRRKRENEEE